MNKLSIRENNHVITLCIPFMAGIFASDTPQFYLNYLGKKFFFEMGRYYRKSIVDIVADIDSMKIN